MLNFRKNKDTIDQMLYESPLKTAPHHTVRRAKQELTLDIRKDALGKKQLYFPFLAISDTHLGTRHSRARRLSHMLEHIAADTVKAVGDVIDFEYMRRKPCWNFAPWHRQALAHLIRKQAQYFSGNHDSALRGKKVMHNNKQLMHRHWVGKKLFGVSIVNEDYYTDPKGRVIKIKHGDDFDVVAFGNKMHFWYHLGDVLHTPIANFDSLVRKTPGFESFSIAAIAKKLVKVVVNTRFGVEDEIVRVVDSDPLIDGLLYGHSHMGGIKRTPQGKLLINDGCTTDHVQAVVHDHKGVFALITWHKDRMDIQEENGYRQTISWKKLGLNAFKTPPTLFKDNYTTQADRIIRVLYRLAPPLDRQEIFKRRREACIAGQEPPPFPGHIRVPSHPCPTIKNARRVKKLSPQPYRPKGIQNKAPITASESLMFAKKL